MLFKRKKENIEDIKAMTISADIIAINNKYGHFEIDNKVGKTVELELEKYNLIFVGGILVDIKEKE